MIRPRRVTPAVQVETVARHLPDPITVAQVGRLDFLYRLATAGHAGRVPWGLPGMFEGKDNSDFAPLQRFSGAAARPGGSRRPIGTLPTALPATSPPPNLSSAAETTMKMGAGAQ